jgi:nitroreductase
MVRVCDLKNILETINLNKKEWFTMQVQEAIQKRLSIRRYADASIPDEHMQILFKAMQLAPSGNNRQNWEFVFVGDQDTKQRLVPAVMNQSFIKGCAYFIAAVADPTLKWHMVDITIALTQFTLQAVELGYGTCWMGAFDEDDVKRVLEIPGDKKVVICMALGTPTGKHVQRGRKAIEEFIYLDQFGNRFKSGGK